MNIEEWLGKENVLGIDIWKNKYQFQGESFDEWLDRISGGNEKFKKLVIQKKFLPGGRILSNRGLNNKLKEHVGDDYDYSLLKIEDGIKSTYSNCYVISPPDDSIESIFECASKLARTYSYGGGCGIDISKLAPRGAKVNNTARETSGSVSFMDLYSLVTGLIGQNGRRGALMISLSCEHPDLEEFIGIKSDLNKITKANISIRITDKFMAAVKNKQPFTLNFTRLETGETITKVVDAAEVFHKICEMNWDYAEPGMLFWDRIETWNLLSCDKDFEYAGVNPCAEEPLPAGGSCLLGSINLSEFIHNGKFDFEDFSNCVEAAVIALNEILDEGLPLHPLKEQRESVNNWRQIGLGIFGLADMLIKLGIRYGSKESIDLCDMIGFKMADKAIETSAKLSKEYGSYPKFNYDAVTMSAFYSKNTSDITKEMVRNYGLRNSQLLTIAPTGSLSSMLGVSGGIEPIFANYYTRKTESLKGHDEYYKVYTPVVKDYMEENGLTDDSQLPNYFVTAQVLNFKERIDMQAIWQKHIDASISSTVNVENDFTVEEVKDLYMYAWEKDLKGVTIFRDGCKRTGILSTNNNEDETEQIKLDLIKPVTREELGSPLPGNSYKKKVACGTLYININHIPDTNDIVEVFVDSGKSGGCAANAACLGRYASAALRAGMKVESVIDATKSVKCAACTNAIGKGIKIDGISCGDVVAKTIKEEYEYLKKLSKNTSKRKKEMKINISTKENEKCPECGAELIHTNGCVQCSECPWTKCN